MSYFQAIDTCWQFTNNVPMKLGSIFNGLAQSLLIAHTFSQILRFDDRWKWRAQSVNCVLMTIHLKLPQVCLIFQLKLLPILGYLTTILFIVFSTTLFSSDFLGKTLFPGPLAMHTAPKTPLSLNFSIRLLICFVLFTKFSFPTLL